ncbi:MAG TPA: hypothetical protein VKV26_16240 [Dehalococcoidia bacterium]|nr:hypothetical protein [Dehalococcoidia bacterium]
MATPYADAPAAPASGLACPQCGDLAEVKKLTAIVAGGTATTAVSGGISARAKTKTTLVTQLAPPPPPALGCLASMFGHYTRETRLKVERHRRQMQRWQKLYYCGRCDIVFDPEEREFAAINVWRAALLGDLEGRPGG